MDIKTLAKDINKETGLVGVELEKMVCVVAFGMAVIANSEDAAKHFESRLKELSAK